MNRDIMLKNLNNTEVFDIAIIGGGATGLYSAVDAASRGYKVILIEQSDFGKGTSSKSTKLAHGGVRYLQQGNISLVLDALKERGLLRRNAPHLVHDLPFIVPIYDWWEGPFYGIGLKLYDLMAGSEGFGSSKMLSKEETLKYIPTLEPEGLKSGVIYYDGQFNDSRLLINMAQTAAEQGAIIINYFRADDFIKCDNLITGIFATDVETNIKYEINAKVVINSTGVFSDQLRLKDNPDTHNLITASQGVHIVLNKKFLPTEYAIMVPHTDDGRIIFAVPWLNKVIVGTTDTPIYNYDIEPKPQKEEVDFLLKHIARYLTKNPDYNDIQSIFTGLRPLVKSHDTNNTSSISRDHHIEIARSGLITITGGKWTTARKMAEDVINKAAMFISPNVKNCITQTLQIHGYHMHNEIFGDLAEYGSDATQINTIINNNTEYNELLHPSYSIRKGEVIWSVRNEMTLTTEDFMARRSRLLFIDTAASLSIAKAVTKLIATERNKNEQWINNQINSFNETLKCYDAKSIFDK